MNALPTRSKLIYTLMATAETLPLAQLEEALDFVGYLQTKQPRLSPAPGSAEVWLRHAGTAHFETGELDQLLAEIQARRDLEIEGHG